MPLINPGPLFRLVKVKVVFVYLFVVVLFFFFSFFFCKSSNQSIHTYRGINTRSFCESVARIE